MNPSRTLKTLMILITAYLFLLTWLFVIRPIVPTAAAEVPEPVVKQGNYTIFQYTQSGWTNRLYVTGYYIKDQTIYYKLREHQGEYMELPFDDCLPQPGWVEDTDELMKYGWWEPGGYE